MSARLNVPSCLIACGTQPLAETERNTLNRYESTIQADLARAAAAVLAAQGHVVTEGEYDLRRTVEVHGADGRRLVVVPLHVFDEEDPSARDADEWGYLVMDEHSTYVDVPEARDGQEPPYGCPSIWTLTFGGRDAAAAASDVQNVLGWLTEHGFQPLAGVRPETHASWYGEAPYPGARAGGSWVVDTRKMVFPVMPDSDSPSGWTVVERDALHHCLDAWLDDQGVAGLEARIPLLSYGSNACPEKFVRNGVSLPGVNLRATVRDLAAVYCQGTRSADGAVPATLAARAGHRETHVVSYVLAADFTALDRVEGRGGRWYDLVLLSAGSVVRDDGAVLQSVLGYVGGRSERYPLRNRDGDLLVVRDTAQTAAQGVLGAATPPILEPDALGPVWPLGAPVAESVSSLFVYGTLMPGQQRWEVLAPFVHGAPEPALVRGSLVDTGHGYPAMFPGEAVVPGYLVRLRADSMVEALDVLDRVEGTATNLFERVLSHAAGTAVWVYRAVDPCLRGTPIQSWTSHTTKG